MALFDAETGRSIARRQFYEQECFGIKKEFFTIFLDCKKKLTPVFGKTFKLKTMSSTCAIKNIYCVRICNNDSIVLENNLPRYIEFEDEDFNEFVEFLCYFTDANENLRNNRRITLMRSVKSKEPVIKYILQHPNFTGNYYYESWMIGQNKDICVIFYNFY
jgi:hypothetical protein